MGVKVAFLSAQEPVAKKGARSQKRYVPSQRCAAMAQNSMSFLVHDSKVERRAVSLGADRGSDVEIMAGVMPGDTLVVGGPPNLQDGDKVEIKK